MIKTQYSVNDIVKFLYPARGKRNTLRNVSGKVVKTGNGPQGEFITVEEAGQTHSFSLKKIVNM